MKNSRNLVVGLFAALLALTSGIYIGIEAQGAKSQPSSLPQGALTHLFSTRLDDSDGKLRDFAQWRGKTLVINFWATWCPPCREEMPSFSRLQAKHVDNGVQFVGIALDSSANVVDYAKSHSISYPLLVADANGTDLTRQLGNSTLALPYTVVIDSAGAARLTHLGRVSEHELDTLLQAIAIRK